MNQLAKKIDNQDMLEITASGAGYDDPRDMLIAAQTNATTPGVCFDCHHVVDDMETLTYTADKNAPIDVLRLVGSCPECGAHSVWSCFDVATGEV